MNKILDNPTMKKIEVNSKEKAHARPDLDFFGPASPSLYSHQPRALLSRLELSNARAGFT